MLCMASAAQLLCVLVTRVQRFGASRGRSMLCSKSKNRGRSRSSSHSRVAPALQLLVTHHRVQVPQHLGELGTHQWSSSSTCRLMRWLPSPWSVMGLPTAHHRLAQVHLQAALV